MGHKKSVDLLFVFLLIAFFVACDEDKSTQISPTVTLGQATATLHIPTLVQAPTNITTMTAVPNPAVQSAPSTATVIRQIPPTVAPTTTPTPPPSLTLREPSAPVLNDFLLNKVSDDFPFITPLTEIAELLYEDVNGDSEMDLVISDYLRVIILLWDHDKYAEPFMLTRMPPTQYTPASRVKFVGYTDDDVPEVIFDHNEDIGGTGLFHDSWIRYIIHCDESDCNSVWEGRIAGHTSDYNRGGMDLFTADLRLETSTERPQLRYISQGFAIYSSGFYILGYQYPSFGSLGFVSHSYPTLTVYTSTLQVYEWDQQIFEIQDEQIIALPRVVQSNATLNAMNENGNSAEIRVGKVDNAATYLNDRCELFLDEAKIGEIFGCKGNFSVVEWRDITGDGRDEIVVTALSGAYDPELLFEIDANCAHQRILAYEWDGLNAREIINTYGCIVQQDFFGVKVEDFDSDGQKEIIAARWDYSADCSSIGSESISHPLYCFRDLSFDLWIYKWNGSRFVYWDSVPGEVLSN